MGVFSKGGSISIHAPTRGATKFEIYNIIAKHDFNPRSYERSDFVMFDEIPELKYISIHAPTRGAT